jgi:class 3 adenylate cyclase/PAS domain-containing protein
VGGNGNGAPQHALKVSLWRERVESSRSRSLVRLRTAVALAIVLLVAGFVGAFVLSRVLLSSYANTGSIINRAGKNRKLSQSCGLFARALQLDLSYPGASAAYSAAAAVEHSASLIKTAEALYSNLNFLISAPVQDVTARDKVWNDVHYEAVSYIPSTSATSVMSYALKDLGYKTASLSRTIASLTASSGGNSSHFATNEAFRFVVDNSFSRLLDNFQNAVRQFVEMFQSTNDSFQTALVSQLALSLAIPILLCALVFLPAYRTFVRERNELYHLLRTVPKPMVRKAYLHAGGKDADASSAKQQDASDEEAGLSDLERMHKACETTDDMADASDMNVKVQGDPLQKTTRRFLLSCILCATAMCALAAEGFFYVKLFETLTIEVNYSGFRRASTHRSRALAQEMLVEDLRAFSGGMSELRTLLLAEIARFMKFDRGLRVGDASLNLPGSDGESSLLDDLYYSPQCSDMSLFKCLSASQMIDRYSQRLTDWASMPTTSLTATSSVYSEILAMEDVLSPLMESAVNLYATRFDGVVQAMSTVADAVFGCTFPILVLCFASVFLAIDELESQTRRARIMYLLLPASFIESAPLVQHLALNITQSNSAVAGQAGKPGGNRDLSQASRSQLIEHAEYVENRYRRLMETSKDGIVELAIHDGDPRVDTCNAAFLSMMGARDSVAVAGRLFFSLLAKEKDVTVVRNAVTTLLGIGDETDSNAKLSVCCNMIRVDSSVLPVRLDLAKSAQTIVMFVRDLTDIQRKEELITYEKQRSEDLLRNVMPDKIARRLQNGETLIADYNEECTIFFSDIKSFTEISNRLSPRQLVVMLNTLLTGMDRLARHYGCERVKSIGDAAFVVCGVPEACTDHALRMVEYSIAVLDMLEMMNSRGMLLPGGECIQLRIGLHSGPVVSGVIGESKFAFDLWSDSVNVASRMESTGIPNKIQITRTTYELLWNQYDFEDRGEVDVKGKGSVHTYLYRGRIQPPKLPEPKWDEVLDIKTACISLNRAAEPHRNKED